MNMNWLSGQPVRLDEYVLRKQIYIYIYTVASLLVIYYSIVDHNLPKPPVQETVAVRRNQCASGIKHPKDPTPNFASDASPFV